MTQPGKRFPNRVHALADLVLPELDPVLREHGFAEAGILMHWPEIVGTRFAEHCRPLKLQWKSRPKHDGTARREPATLVLRVESGFALALQHMTGVIIEKVNGHLGWACVGKIALKQGPLPPMASPKRTKLALDVEASRRAVVAVGRLDEKNLEVALIRLGGRVLTRRPR